MKRADIMIQVSLGDISDAKSMRAWGEFCDKYGFNYYCLNEGTAEKNTTTYISLEDAERWGVIHE